ncbi:MAG: proton-conducting membrane transporter [Clostridiales bacterium]|nr:proton-conducting membrane transporter [Clostridiales bacterium]
MQTVLMILLPLLPLVMAAVRYFLIRQDDGKAANVFHGAALIINLVLTILVILQGDIQLELMNLMGRLPIVLRSDLLSRVFLVLVSVMWLISGLFSFGYMKHEPEGRRRYDAFFLLTLFAMNGLCLSGTLVTMYLFFEMMTLLSIAMVIHTGTREALAAGMKYLLYSVAGAMLGLLGIFFFVPGTSTQIFTPGGALTAEAAAGGLPLVVVFLAVIGFGAKAGMFPLHGWLPTAHPIAPAPASAVLSGVITKMGVLCIIRILYYVVGAEYLRGTWVQTALVILALVTVFMGSMMAFSVTVFKKRLAYSTISQVSYILFGLFLLQPQAFAGSMLHLIFHGVMKNLLFLCAGAVICKTGLTDVRDLTGIGKKMPITMWCFTLAGVGLVGVPPLPGFLSKWELVGGSLNSGLPVLNWLGPVVLLISALLTAGYLLPVSINGFFPGEERQGLYTFQEASPLMVALLVVLAAMLVLLGLWPQGILKAAETLAASLMM